MGKDRNEERNEEEKKRSRDQRKINGEKKKLCGFLEERKCSILNANVKGDEECEWTYTGG